jgi:uncharacterized protein (DUF433 family)
METLLERITINPAVCNNGRPTIRNMRFTLAQLLQLLAPGMTEAEILRRLCNFWSCFIGGILRMIFDLIR